MADSVIGNASHGATPEDDDTVELVRPNFTQKQFVFFSQVIQKIDQTSTSG